MPFDAATFDKNRNAIPHDELAKYAGQWVAWSPDGTHIVAGSSTSTEELDDLVAAAGYNIDDCVRGYVPGFDEVIFGAW